MSHYQREEFKHLAAGHFCYGKPSIDVKELKTYVEGALMAFDCLMKKEMKSKDITTVIEIGSKYEAPKELK